MLVVAKKRGFYGRQLREPGDRFDMAVKPNELPRWVEAADGGKPVRTTRARPGGEEPTTLHAIQAAQDKARKAAMRGKIAEESEPVTESDDDTVF